MAKKLPLIIFSFAVSAMTIYAIIALMIKGILFNPSSYENGAYLLRQSLNISPNFILHIIHYLQLLQYSF